MEQDALNPIVQKMIDAGESEENIATVIQHYKAQSSSPTVPYTPIHPNEQEGAGDWGQNLMSAGQSLAHPQTAGDIAALLIPSGGAEVIGKTLAPVGAAISKYGGAAAKLAGSAATALMPSAMVAPARAALNVLGELKPSEWNSPLTVAGREGRAHAAVAEQVDRFMPNRSGMPTSATVTPASGRVPYAAPTGSAATTTAAAPVATAPLSDLELAKQEVAAGRLPQSVLTAIERGKGGPAKTPPGMIREPLQPIASQRPPMTVSPESPMQPPADSPLQQPRVQVGAEAVGRQNGLSKEAVRQQTGPILGEQPGEASPILPKNALGKIVDALKAMPPGSPDREAYVARATSGKAQWQIENIRRTLEHLGLIVPIAASAQGVRNRVVQMVKGEDNRQ